VCGGNAMQCIAEQVIVLQSQSSLGSASGGYNDIHWNLVVWLHPAAAAAVAASCDTS